MRGSLRALHHRDFALLWSGGLVSNAGSWMQTIAVGVLVTEATGQATWTALVAVAAFLPVGVLSPVGGALADRVDRRRFLIVGNLVEAALAALLAVLAATGRAEPAVVTAIVFAAGCSTALRIPFQQSLLPDVVPREDLLGAVSLASAQFNLGRVVGPAMAGVVIAVGSFTAAFVVNAVSYLAAVIALSLVRLPQRAATDEAGLLSRIRAGARVARREPGCRVAIGLIAVAAFLAAPFISLVPAVASELTGAGEQSTAAATGALTTAQGVGAVFGALVIVPLAERMGRRRLIVADLVAVPAALCLYALAPTVVTAVLAITLVGAAYIGVLSGLSTVVQLRAPEEYRGRVLSLYLVALGVIYPAGSMVQGAVADRIGLGETTILFALVMLVVVVALAVGRPQALAALDDPVAEAEPAEGPEQEPAVRAPEAVAPGAAMGPGGEPPPVGGGARASAGDAS